MIIEGFIDFQNTLHHTFPVTEVKKNSILLKNGYLEEEGFEKCSFPYSSFILGSNEDLNFSKNKVLSNVTQDFVSLKHYLVTHQDFALSIGAWYDESNKEIHLSRDIFGHIPLYYLHVPNHFFAFSSSLTSLVNNKRYREYLQLDVNRIKSYLTFLKDIAESYSGDTFYQNIKSVLPGHILTVENNTVSSKPYVTFNPNKWSHLSTLSDFGKAFRETFQEAVSHVTKDESRILSSHLSGGLDSSSVSSMIKHLYPNRVLQTIYHNTGSTDSDESEYSDSVAQHIGSLHHHVVQSLEDFDLLKTYISLCGQPIASTLSPASIGSIMKYANGLGCNTIISGIGGDSIVGSGLEVILKLYEEKEWEQLDSLLIKMTDSSSLIKQFPNWESYSLSKRRFLVKQNFIYNRIAKKVGKVPFITLYNDFKAVSRSSHMGISYSYFVKRFSKSLLRKVTNQKSTAHLSILKKEFLNSSDENSSSLPVLIPSLLGELPSEYQHWLDDVFFEQAVLADEQRFVLGNYYNVSNRSPFHNKNLFELCMAIPTFMKFGNGRGREHFREAMKGILPENVRNRSSKNHLKTYGQTVTLRLFNQSEDFLINSSKVWEIIDKDKFYKEVETLKNNNILPEDKVRTYFFITRTVSLALWLQWLSNTNKINSI